MSNLTGRPEVDAGDGEEAADRAEGGGGEGGGGRAWGGVLDGGMQPHEAVPDPARGDLGRAGPGARGPAGLVGAEVARAAAAVGDADGGVDQLAHEVSCYLLGIARCVVHQFFAGDERILGRNGIDVERGLTATI